MNLHAITHCTHCLKMLATRLSLIVNYFFSSSCRVHFSRPGLCSSFSAASASTLPASDSRTTRASGTAGARGSFSGRWLPIGWIAGGSGAIQTTSCGGTTCPKTAAKWVFSLNQWDRFSKDLPVSDWTTAPHGAHSADRIAVEKCNAAGTLVCFFALWTFMENNL